ncbi:hypothetical protein [Spirosoma endbachense]|uniref:DUF3575 domain-containing protein n=1 Tax=Spirosoma endbachense TaxID=2666025 RepID=A0A6P1VY27_9BACT|nr:hypothetical protein [Spirosoma endbachense]QHV97218.1 hypothetical protein GJR95_20380 [Spirosoma endbachense]
MKNVFLIGLLFLFSWPLRAQQQLPKSAISIAVEANHVGSSEPGQSTTFKYSLIRTQEVKSSRWNYEVSLGYIDHYLRENFLPFDYFYKGTRSQRMAGDLSFLFNLVKTEKHAFQVGAGPSIWYQRNGIISDLTGISNGQQIEKVTFTRTYQGEFNAGINLKTNYYYSITPKLIAGIRVGVSTNFLTPDVRTSLLGTLSSAGISIGYRF